MGALCGSGIELVSPALAGRLPLSRQESFFFKILLLIFIFISIFWPHYAACGILFPQPGIEHVPPDLAVLSLNHWTAGEVLNISLLTE